MSENVTKKVYELEITGEDSVNSLKSAIEQLNEKLQTLNQTSKEYKETLEELTKLQGQLANAMKGISDAAGSTNQSIDGIKESLNEMGEAISSVGEGVMDSFVNGVVEGFNETVASIDAVNDNLNDLGSISSVKDLKQHISDLRDKLVGLEKGTDDYKATVQELIDSQVKLKEVMNAGKNEAKASEGSYNALSQRMSALKQVWKETTDEATRNEIGQQINEINNELKALDASIGNNQRNVGNYKSALEGLDDSFVNWKQELRECKEALQQLDPASQAYADTMARAAEITHNMADQQEAIKYSSADFGDQLENVRGIASNLAAGYSAVNAAMGLFGQENEEVQQAMLKVQQAMALVQGLQGIDGFIKRTKGLSQSMGLATKATQTNTVATKANATASKQDAQSKIMETTATEGTTVAQKGLNAAMKANPIGFIIGLIASLIAIFTLLKDNIMEMIGANDKLSAAFDKAKAVLAGFGNIIKKSVINPIKLAIIPIKTFAKVMMDLYNRDWSKIGDDIKEGFTEMKDTAIDSINVVGAFKEEFDRKTAEQNEARRKKEAEARAKELDDVIKDNEAKYGSDWKYTQKGKKEYEAYFRALVEMYDKDSEEYKQALRDKAAYDREYYEHQKDEVKKQEDWELKMDMARYGADFQYSKKWYEKKYKKWKQVEDNKNVYFSTGQKQLYEEAEYEWLTYLDAYKKHWEKKTKDMIDSGKKVLNEFKSAFEKFVPEMLRTQWGFDDLKKIWDNEAAMKAYKEYLKEVRNLTDEEVEALMKDIKEKWVFTTDDNLVKSLNTELQKVIYDVDKKTEAAIEKINLMFQGTQLYSRVTFPKDLEKNITDVFIKSRDKIKFLLEDVEIFGEKGISNAIQSIYEDLTKVGGNYAGFTKEQLAAVLPEFQKLLDAETNLKNERIRLNIEYAKSISDIYVKDFENRINIVKEGNQAINDIAQQNFDEQINNAIRWQGVYGNALRDLYEDKDFYTETYEEQKGQLERIQKMYLDMANDEKLTFEEKENAKREAAKITGELIQLEYDKEINMLKVQKGLWKEWVNAVKDAFSGVATILGSLNDYYTANMALEQQRIDQLLENNEISQEDAEKRYQQQEENFNKAKNMEAAMTVINGLSAAIGAYQSLASIPYVGPFLGAAAAAAALAASLVNVQKIRETTMENPYKNAGGGGGSSTTNFQLPNVMELEPQMKQNLTNQNDTDTLNNGGSGGDKAIKAYVVESDVSASQELSRKRSQEITF